MIDWSKVSAADHALILLIADRAKRVIPSALSFDKMSLVMDLSAAHLDVGLRLQELAHADDFNFNHDIAGIVRHMNRETGKLENFFLPRFAARRSA